MLSARMGPAPWFTTRPCPVRRPRPPRPDRPRASSRPLPWEARGWSWRTGRFGPPAVPLCRPATPGWLGRGSRVWRL